MAARTDFVDFYQQLGLRPNCSMEDLKIAYRRRVSELHPDRQQHRAADPAATSRLQELTQAYNEAVAFQRRFGRLPGALHTAASKPAARPQRRFETPSAAPPPRARMGRRAILVIAAAGAALAWLAWNPSESPAPTESHIRRVESPAVAAPADVVATPQHLELGMATEAVEALEGRPMMKSARRWDYGPSWIEFDQDKVSDWYSSRLRPLKVASQRPQAPR